MAIDDEIDDIIKLLRDDKVRSKIVKMAQEVYRYAADIYGNDDFRREHPGLSGEVDDWRLAWFNNGYETWGLNCIFEEKVLAKQGKPWRITMADLAEPLIQLCGIPPYEAVDVDFEQLYAAFVWRLANHALTTRVSDPFPILCLPKNAVEGDRLNAMLTGVVYRFAVEMAEKKGEAPPELPDLDKPVILWERNGIKLQKVGIGYRPGGQGGSLYGLEEGPTLLADVLGNMTPSALRAVQGDLEKVVPSILRSAAFLQGNGEEPPAFRSGRSLAGLPTMEEKSLEHSGPLLRACLDAFYTDPTKKDSITRRIRNAVHLLVESDAQDSDAIGLSLSIAAIDALIGENTGEMSEKLAINTAVLLEPKLESRQPAVEYVKDLYNSRSKALHGEIIDGEPEVRAEARHLASAVLDKLVGRRDFMVKAGYEPDKCEKLTGLLEDLLEGRFRAGQPMGVSETNACSLWRGRQKKLGTIG
jgi:hypothetical protein